MGHRAPAAHGQRLKCVNFCKTVHWDHGPADLSLKCLKLFTEILNTLRKLCRTGRECSNSYNGKGKPAQQNLVVQIKIVFPKYFLCQASFAVVTFRQWTRMKQNLWREADCHTLALKLNMIQMHGLNVSTFIFAHQVQWLGYTWIWIDWNHSWNYHRTLLN